MSDDLFVDGAKAYPPIPGGPALFQSTKDRTFLFASRAARIALTEQNKYQLSLVEMRRKEGVEEVVKGGLFTAQLNLDPPTAKPAEWTAALRALDPTIPADGLQFEPLGLIGTTMSIHVNPALVDNATKLVDIPVGSQTTVPINLTLTPLGAQTMWQTLEQGKGLPITVQFRSTYLTLKPGGHFKITVDSGLVWDAFSLNGKAAASYFGLVDAKVEVDVLRTELTRTGAVKIEWIAKPKGFDESRVAELQKTILDSFTKTALDQMVATVQPDPAAAPNPEGFFGGVSVALKDKHEVVSLQLSAEYDEHDLIEETFGFAYSFAQLPNLNVNDYGTRVTGDNILPINLTFGKNPDVIERFTCQYGYVKADGSVQGGTAEASGRDGLMFHGVLQWPQGATRPTKTQFQYAIDWADPSWEDYAVVEERVNGDSGVLFAFAPNTLIGVVTLASMMEKGEPGSLASFEWHTTTPAGPDGSVPRSYSGSVVYEGKGSAGGFDQRTIRFPYRGDKTTFDWEASLITPDGVVHTLKGTKQAGAGGVVKLTPELLARAPESVAVPQALASLVPADR